MGSRPLSENTDYRSFSVVLIGAESRDEISLNRLMGITRYRTRRYKLTSVPADGDLTQARRLAAAADIVMVNINNPEAIVTWSRIASKLPREHRRPVIRITREKNAQTNPDLTIVWPINPTRVIQTLDRYTIEHLNFLPEFEIGNDSPDSGAVVNLPRTRTPAGVATQQASKVQPAVARKALVADDSLAVRRQLELEFEHLGCELKMVADGEAALAAAQQEHYDIIFLDVIMPGMDGYSVCKGIRRTQKNRQTPVVLLTSKSSHFDKLKGKLSGCDTYLTKPINHNEFCSIAEQHLQQDKHV